MAGGAATVRLGIAILVVVLGTANSVSAADGPGAATVMRSSGSALDATVFSPSSAYAFPDGNWLTGDFDRDGMADLVHLMPRANSVKADVWISNGNGTFAIRPFDPGPGYPALQGAWLAGDVNGDGFTDLVHHAKNKNYLLTWVGQPGGAFRIVKSDPGRAVPSGDWLMGDVTGDGNADLVRVANTNVVELWVSNSDGSGSFRAMAGFNPGQGYLIPNGHWLIGRFNDDPRADLAHMVMNADYAHVWFSNQGGGFDIGSFRPWDRYPMPKGGFQLPPLPLPQIPIPIPSTRNGEWLTLDLNNDDLTDIVHVVENSDIVHLWTSNGKTTSSILFTMSSFRPFPNKKHTKGPWLAGDVNGDGFDDIIHPVEGGDQIQILVSNGQGAFGVSVGRAWKDYPIVPGQVWMAANISNDPFVDLLNLFAINPVRRLKVSRHASVSLTGDEAERIVNDMTEMLFRNDDPTDQACSTRFVLDGSVEAFSATEGGVIANAADFAAVMAVPGPGAKVVNQINWCGVAVDSSVNGCGLLGDKSFAVVRLEDDDRIFEGALWAHEHGHTRGLNHRTSSTSLMNRVVDDITRGVTLDECRKMPQ
jgi:hypothetical protein